MNTASPRSVGPSLQSRLTRLLLGLFAIVWLGTAVLAWFDARHEVEEILDSHLAQAAALLVAQPLRADAQARIDTPVLHRYAAKTALQVWGDGALLLRSATAPVSALASHPKIGFQTVWVGEQPWRVLVAAGALPGQQVQVGQAVAARDDVLWAMFRSTLWPLLLALPLMGLGIWAVVRHALRPLRTLGEVLHARQADALERIPDTGLPREIRPMLEALNLLFERTAGLLSSERRFTADAAHELRTPIAALRAHAEVALRAEADGDDEGRRQALARTLTGCDRATHLVTQLLTLSRLEADTRINPRGPDQVDLVPLARQELAALAPLALAQGQQLSLEALSPCFLFGDEALLTVLLRNLIHNAVQHAGPGARIEVTLEAHEGQIWVAVEDSGPGLDDADLQRLGERFFRPAGTRASGSGLGWSIASRIAQAHGLRLQARRSERLGGFSAVLRRA